MIYHACFDDKKELLFYYGLCRQLQAIRLYTNFPSAYIIKKGLRKNQISC